jgi:hypothetical protein
MNNGGRSLYDELILLQKQIQNQESTVRRRYFE